MAGKLIFLLVAVLLGIVSGSSSKETSTAAAVRHYLQNTIKSEFEDWLKNNNESDPTPVLKFENPISEYVHTHLFRLSYLIKSQEMVGFVNDMKYFVVDQVNVDLIQFQISITLNTTGIAVFKGEYKTDGIGSLFTGLALVGKGEYNMTVQAMQHVLSLCFDVGSDGYIRLKNTGSSLSVTLDVDEERTCFQGLWDDGAEGFASDIRKEMTNQLIKRYSGWDPDRSHPSGNLIMNFLKEVLAKSSLQEIVETPPPVTAPATENTDDTTPSPTLPSSVETTNADSSTEASQGSPGSRPTACSWSIIFLAAAMAANNMGL